MPLIDISQNLFVRCQKLAVPLVDTIEDVLMRAIDALESNGTPKVVPSIPIKSHDQLSTITLQYDDWDKLKFATVKSISINRQPLSGQVHWNGALAAVISHAAQTGMSIEAIQDLLIIPNEPGPFQGPGYRYVAAADLAFQQQNSTKAWRQIVLIAQRTGVSVSVDWLWSQDKGAYVPGALGSISIN